MQNNRNHEYCKIADGVTMDRVDLTCTESFTPFTSFFSSAGVFTLYLTDYANVPRG